MAASYQSQLAETPGKPTATTILAECQRYYMDKCAQEFPGDLEKWITRVAGCYEAAGGN